MKAAAVETVLAVGHPIHSSNERRYAAMARRVPQETAKRREEQP